MRWTDLPPDREPADARAPVLPQGEWDELRRRLERLPPGHPSRPGDDGGVDEDPVGQERERDGGAVQGRAAEDRSPGRRGAEDRSPGRRGAEDRSPGRRGAEDGNADRRGEPGGPRERDAGTGAVPGRHEPYRPWFTAGESPQPWFAEDPGEEP